MGIEHLLPDEGKGAGLILKPGATAIQCGRSHETHGHCNDMDCHDRSRRPWNEISDKDCTLEAEDIGWQLHRLTIYQEKKRRGFWPNEMVLDAKQWPAQLPQMVEAVFGDRYLYEDFLRQFGDRNVTRATVPFVSLDFSDWNAPFALRSHE